MYIYTTYTGLLSVQAQYKVKVKIYVTTDGQSVCLGVKHPSGAYDQIYIYGKTVAVC
jgi:hypothetical protein